MCWHRQGRLQARTGVEGQKAGHAQLQVDRGGGHQVAALGGQLPGARQAVCPVGPHQVERAELVGRPSHPQRQPASGRDVELAGEHPLGLAEVAVARGPAEHLQRLARLLREIETLGAGQHAPRGRLRLGAPGGAQQHLRGQGIDADQLRLLHGEPAGRRELVLGCPPLGGRDRCLRQPHVHPRPARRVRRRGDQAVTDAERRVDVPGPGTDLGPQLVDVVEQVRAVRRQVPGLAEDGRGGQQRTSRHRPLRSRQQQPRGINGVPAQQAQLGGQLAPRAGQVRVQGRQNAAGPQGQDRAHLRVQPGQHRVAGQGVPEPEHRAVPGHQLQLDAAGQYPGHLVRRPAHRRPEQRRVQPPHKCRQVYELTVGWRESLDAPAHRLAEGPGDHRPRHPHAPASRRRRPAAPRPRPQPTAAPRPGTGHRRHGPKARTGPPGASEVPSAERAISATSGRGSGNSSTGVTARLAIRSRTRSPPADEPGRAVATTASCSSRA